MAYTRQDLNSTITSVEAYLKKMEMKVLSCSMEDTIKAKHEYNGIKQLYTELTFGEGKSFIEFMNNEE